MLRDTGQGRTRKGREYNVEGRFISNINAFGRWNGFRRIRDAIVQQQQAPSRSLPVPRYLGYCFLAHVIRGFYDA